MLHGPRVTERVKNGCYKHIMADRFRYGCNINAGWQRVSNMDVTWSYDVSKVQI